jgi:hypothetical protein
VKKNWSKVVELLAEKGASPAVPPDTSPRANPLAQIVRAVVVLRRLAENANQVEKVQYEKQLKEALKAAKELINHPDADLKVGMGERTNVLSFIVDKEIEVLILHPKVQALLDTMWGGGAQASTKNKPKKRTSIMKQILEHVKSRRARFAWSAFSFGLFLACFCAITVLNTLHGGETTYYFVEGLRESIVKEEFPTYPPKTFESIQTIDDFWLWARGPLYETLYSQPNSSYNYFSKFLPTGMFRQHRTISTPCEFHPSLK